MTNKCTNECSICTDCILYPELVSTKCGHTFHRKCLNKWLNKNNVCPNCRTEEPWNEFIKKDIITMKCTCNQDSDSFLRGMLDHRPIIIIRPGGTRFAFS